MTTMKNILVVDDDIDILEQVSLTMKAEGYDVATAASQEEAEETLLQFIPDREPPAGGTIRAVTDQLRDLLQTALPIVAEPVKLLPPLTSGKFRLTYQAD